MTTLILKHCKRCHTDKPEIAFAKDRSNADGRFTYCRQCQKDYYVANKERLRAWQHANPDKIKQYNRTYYKTELGRLFRIQGVKLNAKLNPQKTNARAKAFRHREEIMAPCCEVCGSKENLQRHHPDYSRPLDIQTLCDKCHKEVHGHRHHAA